MPRNEQVLVVFVASPADLEAERDRLEEVIRELNVTWSQTLGVRLELVRWETHGYPGIGADAQDVLNQELPDNYDIFVGLMWGRYGTATGRSGSGTQEEFDLALARFRADPHSVRIMFYFKDAPLPPSSIDAEQLAKVQSFRSSLGTEGTLYWPFVTLDEFERLIRLHLTRQIQEIIAPRERRQDIGTPSASLSPLPDDELGLLDFLDIAEERFAVLNQITERIGTETVALGAKMHQRTEDIHRATADTQGQLARRDARTLIENAAVDMAQYVARVRAELPLFRESLQQGADAVGRAVLIRVDFGSEGRTQIRSARAELAMLADALSGSYDATENFRATVQAMPRMTVVLNRAKRDTADVLEEVAEGLAAGRRVALETIRALDTLLGEAS